MWNNRAKHRTRNQTLETNRRCPVVLTARQTLQYAVRARPLLSATLANLKGWA